MLTKFFQRVVVDPSGCWLWTGERSKAGYGRWRVGGRGSVGAIDLRAHRVAFMALRGPVLEGLVLDHLCRVITCVNPAHLEPVTPRENQRRGLSGVLRPATCRVGHQRWARGKKWCLECDRLRQLAVRARARATEASHRPPLITRGQSPALLRISLGSG